MCKTKKCETLEEDIWFLFLGNTGISHYNSQFAEEKKKYSREHGNPISHCKGMKNGKDIQL
jgi:hypothetical protein